MIVKIVNIFSLSRHILVVVGSLVTENNTYLSFHFDYERNLWTQKDLMTKTIRSSHKKSFVLNVFGQIYFLRSDGETYAYDIKNHEWGITSPIIDDKILEESAKLSIIRFP